jgi:methylthioribose-1-phosphate isomerase
VLHWVRVATLEEAAHAIRAMQVRGAPLIGVTAAYGLAHRARFRSLRQAPGRSVAALLRSTRPTAVNLHWALARMEKRSRPLPPRRSAAPPPGREAAAIAEEDVAQNAAIGQHGLALCAS